MNLNANLVVYRPRRHVIRSTMVAVLTMTAIVLGLLALHSAAAGDETSGPVSIVSAHNESVPAEPATGSVALITPYVDGGSHTVDNRLLVGCVIMGMVCVALLILATVVFLARPPAVYRRLLDAGGFVVDSFREIPLHLHRPSLTLLSISRV
ncbi:hypothetical protein E3T46_11010 [Cryobacterium sp. Hh11]|uniref:hypothetical protein n=1 Tax=Cryobacterium sp. Hh11 TaxID=2555868 RepID=UPI00106D1491|nr:hypothetical protein [Cryobacterium sp. Hh11]TFD50419.1 hypothetical protein E3T46_11010 [Cryobacterium sp. Hh11]